MKFSVFLYYVSLVYSYSIQSNIIASSSFTLTFIIKKPNHLWKLQNNKWVIVIRLYFLSGFPKQAILSLYFRSSISFPFYLHKINGYVLSILYVILSPRTWYKGLRISPLWGHLFPSFSHFLVQIVVWRPLLFVLSMYMLSNVLLFGNKYFRNFCFFIIHFSGH